MNMKSGEMGKCKYITEDEIQFFDHNGYLILKSIIPSDECARYDREVIQPALQRHASLDENNPSTWFIRNNPKLKDLLTQKEDADYDGIPVGIMVHDPNNKEHNCDPIPAEDSYWSALFDNERLIGVLDELHNLPSVPETQVEEGDAFVSDSKKGDRRWTYIHPGSVGWIHVRLPICYNYNDEAKDIVDESACDEITDDGFYIPKGEKTWHVDGGHFSPHRLSSIEQSVVLLPMIRNVEPNGGGNTVILAGSHSDIAKRLCSEKDGIDKHILNNYCEEMSKVWPKNKIVEAAPCNAGDVLLLHPFLVHSAGRNTRKVKNAFFRLTFNVGTRWASNEILTGTSTLEWMIKKSLNCTCRNTT